LDAAIFGFEMDLDATIVHIYSTNPEVSLLI